MADSTTKSVIRIDGILAPVKNVRGGFPRADVQTTFPLAGAGPKRQISSARYTDLRFDIGVGMGGPILNWVNAAFTLVASIGAATERPGDNVIVPNVAAKPLLIRNFRIKIPGLPTTRVSTIAPFAFRRATSGMLPPDLIVTLANVEVAPWKAWVKDFIVGGNNGQDKEKQGVIEWMSSDFSTVVAKLTIGQIGIFELAPVADATPASHRASMYFELGQLSLA
jgi:hypothetical protein